MKNKIVISRYDENLDWLDLINQSNYDIVIYNKGNDINRECIKLDNVGREAHTFLTYIVDNYDNLPEYTIFLQGEPFYHCTEEYRNLYFDDNSYEYNKNLDYKYFIDLINSESFVGFNLVEFLNNELKECYIGDAFMEGLVKQFELDDNGFNINSYLINLFNDENLELKFIAGAQYCVLKETIRKRSLQFYKTCLEYSLQDDKFPWVMERFWYKIFFTNEKTKF